MSKMNYDSFKKHVIKTFVSFLPPEYQESEVKIQPSFKNNQRLDALLILPKNNESGISPTLYLQDLYARYRAGDSLIKVMMDAAEVYRFSFKDTVNIPTSKELEDLISSNKVKESVILQLIHTESNQEYLKSLPHREFEDLSVIYRWVVADGMAGIIITNQLLQKMRMTEKELYQYAYQNTLVMNPFVISDMNTLLCRMMPIEEDQISKEMIAVNRNMIVIHNESGVYGATVMLYPELLQSVASQVKDNLYILPSSIHEIIAIPEAFANTAHNGVQNLMEMVREINQTQVFVNERLSNQIYFFDKETCKVKKITETEPNLLYNDTERQNF